MLMVLTHLETTEEVVEREWSVEGIPVLTARLSLPTLTEAAKKPPLRKIESYYRQFGRSYLRYCERFLLPRAEVEFHRALAASAPLPQGIVTLSHYITYNEEGLWSLYTESREQGLGTSLRVRRGDCWQLCSGAPLPLSASFPPRTPCRRLLAAAAADEIRRQTDAGTALYRENWQRLLRRELSAENFYISPAGLHFFYQMFTVAPGVEGIPTFLLPPGAGGLAFPTISQS